MFLQQLGVTKIISIYDDHKHHRFVAFDLNIYVNLNIKRKVRDVVHRMEICSKYILIVITKFVCYNIKSSKLLVL